MVSGMEVVLFSHAYRRELFRRHLTPEVYRYGALMSFSPVLFFLASIPVAFASTAAAAWMWLLGIPMAVLAQRWKPEGADEQLFGFGDSVPITRSRPAAFAAYSAVSARAVKDSALSVPSHRQTPAEQLWPSGSDPRRRSSISCGCGRTSENAPIVAPARNSPPRMVAIVRG